MKKTPSPAAGVEPAIPRKRKGPGPPSQFRIVACDPTEVSFSARERRESAYLNALRELAALPARSDGKENFLEFEKPMARGAIGAQAKKHGIRVLFGEREGKLIVRLVGVDSPEGIVLELLAAGPRTLAEIAGELERRGFKSAVPREILQALADNHKAQLLSEAGGVKRWHATKAQAA